MTKSEKSQKATATHRKVQSSTTRNRRTVKKKTPEVAMLASTETPKKVVLENSTEEKKLEQAIKVVKVEKTEKKAKKVPAKKAKKIAVLEASEVAAAEEAEKVAKLVKPEEPEIELPKMAEPEVKLPEAKAVEPKVEMTEPEEKAPEPEAKTVESEVKTLEPEAKVIMPKADLGKVRARMQARSAKKPEPVAIPARELKKQAIEKALSAASKTPRKKEPVFFRFDWKRAVLALVCATAAVFAIVYFVNLNAPDISLKVAAMQTGIEASYPGYVPRDYLLTDITSEEGRVVLNFKNSENNGAFSIIEEKSSWDSNALLANYVKPNFSDEYSTVKEQGLTIYIDNGDAAWVNGGIVFKIKTISGTLTKKQITNIAVSL